MCLVNEEEAVYECDNISCSAVVSFDENKKCSTCNCDLCIDCKTDHYDCDLCLELENMMELI